MKIQHAHLSVMLKKMKFVALSQMISGMIFIDKKGEMGAQVGVNGCIQQ